WLPLARACLGADGGFLRRTALPGGDLPAARRRNNRLRRLRPPPAGNAADRQRTRARRGARRDSLLRGSTVGGDRDRLDHSGSGRTPVRDPYLLSLLLRLPIPSTSPPSVYLLPPP